MLFLTHTHSAQIKICYHFKNMQIVDSGGNFWISVANGLKQQHMDNLKFEVYF